MRWQIWLQLLTLKINRRRKIYQMYKKFIFKFLNFWLHDRAWTDVNTWTYSKSGNEAAPDRLLHCSLETFLLSCAKFLFIRLFVLDEDSFIWEYDSWRSACSPERPQHYTALEVRGIFAVIHISTASTIVIHHLIFLIA